MVRPVRPSGRRAAWRGVLRAALPLPLMALALGAQGGMAPPSPDPRVGLKPGLMDAGEAAWNLRLVGRGTPPEKFVGSTNSDLAFTGSYAIQGNYNGWQIWDLAQPSSPTLVTAYYCPASQSDVSVYRNLLFISGEGLTGRLDCGGQGVPTAVSRDRLRGLRIFDISDIRNPRNVGNVQTCRGSHTHTVLVDPKDSAHVYVYISGSASVRPADELPGCSAATPDRDPNSALFRIEVIKVPVADPAKAAIVSSPRIFNDLVAPPQHGLSPADLEEIEAARRRGAFVIELNGVPRLLPDRMVRPALDSVAKAGGRTAPNGADSAAVKAMLTEQMTRRRNAGATAGGPRPGPTQCHDITVYPAIGLAGGACEGYGLLLDISDPANPKRVAAVADSNFSYWHSATFSNDGSKVLFTDEWGGGSQPKCRASDPKEWGANAIFTIGRDRAMTFRSYYKLPAPQTSLENCVAHNGSLIPVPGRDIMVQSWYQGGISVFDWTDPAKPVEIAFHDRGPTDATRMGNGGSWSVYWYNGVIVNSEIARGLDVFELQPSAWLSANEIAAAKTVKLDYLNAQGQPQFTWPPSFAKARALADQLERSQGLTEPQLRAVRAALDRAEAASGARRTAALRATSQTLAADERGSGDAAKVRMLRDAVLELAGRR